MPIKRLMGSNGRPALPTIGKLHKGEPKGEGRGFPKELDHFRFSGATPEVQAAFLAAYGAAPRSLQAYLPYPDAGRCFGNWVELWDGAGRLVWRGDGEYLVAWRDDRGGYVTDPYMVEKRPQPQGEAAKGARCYGRLSVILPELWEAGQVGLVTLVTTSVYDILHLNTVLEEVALERRAAGSDKGLMGVGFTLSRVQEMINTTDARGAKGRSAHWLVKIAPTAEYLMARLLALKTEALGGTLLDACAGIAPGARTVPGTLESFDDAPDPDDAPAAWNAGGVDPTTGEIIDLPHPEAGGPATQVADDADGEWANDQAQRKAFFAFAKSLGVSAAEVAETLGVKTMRDVITKGLDREICEELIRDRAAYKAAKPQGSAEAAS